MWLKSRCDLLLVINNLLFYKASSIETRCGRHLNLKYQSIFWRIFYPRSRSLCAEDIKRKGSCITKSISSTFTWVGALYVLSYGSQFKFSFHLCIVHALYSWNAKEGDPQICGFLRLVDLRVADPIRPNKPAAKIDVVFCHERAEKRSNFLKEVFHPLCPTVKICGFAFSGLAHL
jgi:hypothetical protein